uniref:SH3b domain-containing protein n=1 Tax=Caenorhabditis tropicalis TaxID=1561998 RepID=A0A1I7V074_9PELO
MFYVRGSLAILASNLSSFNKIGSPSHGSKSTKTVLDAHFPGYLGTDMWPDSSPDKNPLFFSVWGYSEEKPPFIEITTTQRVEEPTAEAPTTGDLTTVITTTESLMKDETTEKASTATQNPKILTTEEQKTAETTTNKPVDWSTDKMKTEETTSETKIYSFSTVDPSAIIRLAPGKFSDNTLPDGRKISDLGNDFKIYSGINDWSRIVANNKAVYVLHPVQRNDGKTMFDPYTIGQVLGYIYEKRNLDKINHLEANIQSN